MRYYKYSGEDFLDHQSVTICSFATLRIFTVAEKSKDAVKETAFPVKGLARIMTKIRSLILAPFQVAEIAFSRMFDKTPLQWI